METYLFWLVPIASILALAFAGYFYKQMMRESEGSPEMQKIAAHVRKGAMSYLKQQYKVVTLVLSDSLFCLPSWHTDSICKITGFRLLSLQEDSSRDCRAIWE